MEIDPKHTLSLTEARQRIFELANDVQKPGAYYMLTDKGRAKAVILSAEEFDSIMETIEVQQQFPDLDKDSKKAWRDYERGDVVTLDELLEQEGYVIADKGKKKYVARRRSQKDRKRGKKS